MTTLTVNSFSGIPVVADQVVAAVDSIEIPIFADGILFVVATLISRFVNRVFGAADSYSNLEDVPDYYFPPSCCG